MTEAYLTPSSVRVEEVMLVQIWRGADDLFRPVLRVYSKSGEFLAEHDGVHRDPEYASYYLRDHARHGLVGAARARARSCPSDAGGGAWVK